MHNNDRLNATAKRRGGGREREIRVKGTVLDAYHQRELKSCNRSKKHPWAVKSRSGRRQREGKSVLRIYTRRQALLWGGRGGWSNQTIHRH